MNPLESFIVVFTLFIYEEMITERILQIYLWHQSSHSHIGPVKRLFVVVVFCHLFKFWYEEEPLGEERLCDSS